MVLPFENDERGYLAWVVQHPDGYVVNLDKKARVQHYPMVHRATHNLISSPARTNYTSGEYLKFCSTELDELETWAQRNYGRALTRCATCM